MDKLKDESIRKAKEEEAKLARRQSFPELRQLPAVESGQTQPEQEAKSEPIPPHKFVSDVFFLCFSFTIAKQSAWHGEYQKDAL